MFLGVPRHDETETSMSQLEDDSLGSAREGSPKKQKMHCSMQICFQKQSLCVETGDLPARTLGGRHATCDCSDNSTLGFQTD